MPKTPNISPEQMSSITQKVSQKIKFYSHLASYLCVCTGLTALDYFGGDKNLRSLDWVGWVWLGWGIGIIVNGISVFGLGNIEARMIRSEIEKVSKD
jgi:hypothetical protein